MLTSQKTGNVSEYLTNEYFEIAERIAKRLYWLDDDHRSFSITMAYEDCLRHGLKFNPEKLTNAYAYVTQIIMCSFAQSYLKIKKERNGPPR